MSEGEGKNAWANRFELYIFTAQAKKPFLHLTIQPKQFRTIEINALHVSAAMVLSVCFFA